MNTVNSLAGGDPLKYEKILEMDYNTIFMRLQMNKTEIVFQRSLNAIYNNQSTQKNK